jgi:hypothetical protein
MQRMIALLFVVGTFCSLAGGQNSVTITTDDRDLSRPVSTLINQIRKRERVSITYEDPRYANSAELDDVTDKVSKSPDVERRYEPRIIVPKGHPLTFVYSPSSLHDQDAAKATIERMLQEYSSLGGSVFAVRSDGIRLQVVPREVLNAEGVRLPQESILDTTINVAPAERNGGEILEAICAEIRKQTGYVVGIGPSVPGNYLARYKSTEGIQGTEARLAIAQLLDAASVRDVFDWDLYYDPGDKAYMLNFAYVGLAAPVQPAHE